MGGLTELSSTPAAFRVHPLLHSIRLILPPACLPTWQFDAGGNRLRMHSDGSYVVSHEDEGEDADAKGKAGNDADGASAQEGEGALRMSASCRE